MSDYSEHLISMAGGDGEARDTLTNDELAILAVLTMQVDAFFPELGPKLLKMKAALEATK